VRPVHLGTAIAVCGAVHAAVNARLLRRPSAEPSQPLTGVSVLVPARDEERNIADCLRTLLAQQPGDGLEIIVLDDESSDRTRETALAVAAGDPRVRVVRGTPPPPGRLGKPHACGQLARAARPASRVLVFADADVRFAPHAIAAAVDMLGRHDLDLVSPYPRQVATGAGERLVQPLLQWSWLTFLPLRLAESSPRRSLSAANGQFLAVRRDAYERAGGHAAADVLDDLALVRAVKRAGGRGGIVDGTGLASCRMYDGWPQLRDGYAKSLWAAFGSPGGAAATIGLLGAAYVLPAIAALRGSRAGAIGYAAGVAGRVIAARRTGGRAWPDALAHPASVVALGLLTARSLLGHLRGTLTWKRRVVGARRNHG
jgi:cellulose synthase/poly-beta-1,6-N-acetylglucosamine synthase-like glycosyltransferase